MHVLIVDDQRLSRKGIIKMIEWEQLNLNLAGECANGEEALRFLEDHPVDIVLTDIRMPVMDGLQFADQARDWDPNLSVIIFSGYDDFHYIRKSLQISVTDYLLKPVNKDELNDTLRRLIEEKNKSWQAQQESLQKFRAQFFYAYLEGGYEDQNNLELDYQSIQFGAPHDPICAIIMEDLKQEQHEETTLSAIIDNQLERSKYTIIKIRNVHVLLLSAPVLDENRILDIFKKWWNRSVCRSVSIGPVVNHISDLRHSFENAYNAYILQAHLSIHEPIAPRLYKDIRAIPHEKLSFDTKNEQEWIFHLKSGHADLSEQLLRKILISNRTNLDDYADSMYQYLLLKGSKELYQEGIIDESQFLEACALSRNLPHEHNIMAKEQQLVQFFQNSLAQSQRWNEQQTHEQIEKAKRYIEEHYLEAVNMSSLAQQYFMSPSYFSLMFRRITGVNFLEYVTQLRMEFAKKMFREQNNLKIYEIAAMCGYQDVKYFRKLFKKYTGMTPQHYKEHAHD